MRLSSASLPYGRSLVRQGGGKAGCKSLALHTSEDNCGGQTMTEFTNDNAARSKIKPIPTTYKGYKFRSRLEARWSIFFDTLDIKWDYEVEGVDLKQYGWYLPDFYLPQVKQFAEVKPIYEDGTSVDIDKLKMFVECTGFPIVLLNGPPDYKFYQYFFKHEDKIIDLPEFVGTYHNYYTDEQRFYSNPAYPTPFEEDLIDEQYISAVYSARAARFEHGESP